MATDEAFRANIDGSCDTSFVGYYTFALITIAIKLLSVVKQFANWFQRPTHRSKLPRGPLISLVFASSQLLFMFLIGFNLASYRNGVSFVLLSIGFLPFAHAYSIGLVRLVNLGEKILPKSSRNAETIKRVTGFDGPGKLLFAIQVVSLVVSTVVLIVLSPILVEYEMVLSHVGFGTKALFMLFCIGGYVYHFERCIRAIQAVQRDVHQIKIANSGAKEPGDASDLRPVVRKMRLAQLPHLCGTSPAALIYLLIAVDAVPATVYTVITTILLEASGSVFLEFVVRRKAKTLAPPSSSRSGGANDNNINKAVVEGNKYASNNPNHRIEVEDANSSAGAAGMVVVAHQPGTSGMDGS